MPEVLCLSNWRTRKSIFRNRPRDDWGICNSMHGHSSALFLQCLRTMFPHTLSCKALYQRWTGYCPLDRHYTCNRRLHATTMIISNGDGTALYALFLPVGKLLKISRWAKKAINTPLGKGGAESVPCFHSLEGKKINPPSNLYSDLWLIQCWSECKSLQSIL